MIRLDESPGALTVTSRLAPPRAVIVLALGLALCAAAAFVLAGAPAPAFALGAAALALLVLGGRAVRARFEPGRGAVTVLPAVPVLPAASARLSAFVAARVETVAEARRRRADALAARYAARSGGRAMPPWLRPPATPGRHDHLRRIVLVAASGAHLPVTAWLAPADDLEPGRQRIEALLGGG